MSIICLLVFNFISFCSAFQLPSPLALTSGFEAMSGISQFFALGVPSDGALDVYLGISGPQERLPALASGAAKCNADHVAARVAEAVALESLIHWQRKVGLVGLLCC